MSNNYKKVIGYFILFTYIMNKKRRGSEIKNVNFKISVGKKGQENYAETTLSIKFDEIGPKGFPGKKYFQIVKIIPY